jgi:hypothetical protein
MEIGWVDGCNGRLIVPLCVLCVAICRVSRSCSLVVVAGLMILGDLEVK